MYVQYDTWCLYLIEYRMYKKKNVILFNEFFYILFLINHDTSQYMEVSLYTRRGILLFRKNITDDKRFGLWPYPRCSSTIRSYYVDSARAHDNGRAHHEKLMENLSLASRGTKLRVC